MKINPVSYEKMTDENLYGLLLTEGDRLPREAIDEVVRRGAESIGAMEAIIDEEDLWEGEFSEWWAPLHAVHVLGTIGGKAASAPLLMAIELADRYDNEWVIETLPSIIGTMPPSIVEEVKSIVMDTEFEWFTRIHAAECLAALTIHNPSLESDVFRFLGDIFLNSDEDEMIDHVGCILMDFLRREYYDALCERGRDRGGFGVVFTEDDVKGDFARGRCTIHRYTKDWLSFYDPREIEKRQRRWAEEDSQKDVNGGKILDDGMCICSQCGRKKRIGGFTPSAPSMEEGVRCIDCMNVLSAEKEGISVEAAALQREKMMETSRLMNSITVDRYFKESGKEEFDSQGEANQVIRHVSDVWNSLSTEERRHIDELSLKEKKRYFNKLPVDFKGIIHIHQYGKPGRNDPCFCGSGKKFKKCCIDKVH